MATIGTLERAEYQRRLNIGSAWSRHINNRKKETFLLHYAGDLIYDGFTIATTTSGGPVVGVLRDYGSHIIVSETVLEAAAKVNPPSETVEWTLYDPTAKTNGWEGAFVPCTVEEARAAFQATAEVVAA